MRRPSFAGASSVCQGDEGAQRSGHAGCLTRIFTAKFWSRSLGSAATSSTSTRPNEDASAERTDAAVNAGEPCATAAGEDAMCTQSGQATRMAEGRSVAADTPVSSHTAELLHVDDSVILADAELLANLQAATAMCGPGAAPRLPARLRLLFRATRDGPTDDAFHAKCDGHGATFSLVRSKKGNVFGGFSALPWAADSEAGYQRDPDAFIFSLRGPQARPGAPLRLNFANTSEKAVYHGQSYGPCFGKRAMELSGKMGKENAGRSVLPDHYALVSAAAAGETWLRMGRLAETALMASALRACLCHRL
jgi:hypothetical protein